MEGAPPQAARVRRLERAGLGRRPRLRRPGPGLCRGGRVKRRAARSALNEARADEAPGLPRPLSRTSGAEALIVDGARRVLGDVPADVAEAAVDARCGATSRMTVDSQPGRAFLQVFNPPLAADRDRRRAHRAGAGADGVARRLPRDGDRPAPRLRHRQPLPGRRHERRLAGRGDGRRWRPTGAPPSWR